MSHTGTINGPIRPNWKAQRTCMHVMDDISRGFEWVGVAVIVAAFVVSLVSAARHHLDGAAGTAVYEVGRGYFGRGILLGLEVLVAADLIRTVAVQPTLENVEVLALIVAVRTFLSFSIDVEIAGVLPWRKRAELPNRGHAASD